MRVLLLGEMSGVHTNLAIGLREIGIKVEFYARKDGWKDVKGDKSYFLGLQGTGFFPRISRLLFPLLFVRKFSGYDVVSLAGVQSFRPHFVSKLKRSNRKVVSFCCGSDRFTVRNWLTRDFSPILGEALNGEFNLIGAVNRNRDYENAKLVDLIIPTCPSYRKGVDKLINVSDRNVRLPFSELHHKKSSKVGKRIKIYHGITRRGFKGSELIIRAMSRLQNDFPNLVEIRVTERLKYQEYVDELSRCDIMIDQCFIDTYGMNAVIAMSLGKVVLSGNSFSDCPVVKILPDEDFIYKTLVRLIYSDLGIIKNMSYQYFIDNHNAKKVAEEWIKLNH